MATLEFPLVHVNAAAVGAGSASSFWAAMSGVLEITQGLISELKRTGG